MESHYTEIVDCYNCSKEVNGFLSLYWLVGDNKSNNRSDAELCLSIKYETMNARKMILCLTRQTLYTLNLCSVDR
jgi:hypothetical protein